MNKKWWFLVAFVIVCVVMEYGKSSSAVITEKQFETMFLSGQVKKVSYILNRGVIEIETKEPINSHGDVKKRHVPFLGKQTNIYSFRIPSIIIFNDKFKELESKVPQESRIGYETIERISILSIVYELESLLGVLLLIWLIKGRNAGGMGPFGMGRSNVKMYDKKHNSKVTFKDIAGLHEVKQEVQEVVDFLTQKGNIEKIGGKIPKGMLLVGPPGNGKTLLAKAIAGEAGVPFFSMSGADFVEMFVGVGAARVRSLFQQAKAKAPAIIFIDELDAIGKSRRRTLNGNEEQENTLNALLVEMDGFQDNLGVVVVGATNRPEILDDALLRPGRFDRQIAVDNPALKDREEMFELYLKKIKVDRSVDVKHLAEQTVGFSSAEIANVCNEAALLAIRSKKKTVSWTEMQEAMDRIIGGIEKKGRIVSDEEKKIVAYHEAGHAVASWFLEYAHPLLKVSIIPRGIAALGYAQYTPKEQNIRRKEELFDELCSLLGGRIAEKIVFEKVSTGAVNDLQRSTDLAYKIVMVYGMDDAVGPISYVDFYRDKMHDGARPYSEEMSKLIDNNVRSLIAKAFERTEKLLMIKMDSVKLLAENLLQKEVIYRDDVEKIIGERIFVSI